MTQLASQRNASISTQRYVRASFDMPAQTLLMTPTAQSVGSLWNGILGQLRAWRELANVDGKIDGDAANRAIRYAQLLLRDGESIPTRVGTTNSGGVAFEWRHDDILVHVEIIDGLRAEYTEFRGKELTEDADLVWSEDAQAFCSVH